jgi:hypothetical protein
MLSPLSIEASRLVVGEPYFIVTYADDALTTPLVISVIYIGVSLDGENDRALYFQDAESFYKLGAYPSWREVSSDESEHARVIVIDEVLPPNIFAIDGLIDELSRAAGRSPTIDRPDG